jgi:hypothetical protein
MTQRIARGFFVFSVFLFSSTVSSAATFSYSVTCGSATLGPVTVLADTVANSGTINLTPNVPATGLTITSEGDESTQSGNTTTSGSFNATRTCTLTLGSGTASYQQSISMTILPGGSPTCGGPPSVPFGCLNFAAVSVSVNVGVQGTVVVSAPAYSVAGYDASRGGITIVPGAGQDTATLFAVPPAGTPVPPSLLLALTGLAAAAMYQIARRPGLRRSF